MATRPTSAVIPFATPEALVKNPNMRLSDPAMKPTMDAIRQKIKNDPTFGHRLLRQAGIIGSNGKLTKSFGG